MDEANKKKGRRSVREVAKQCGFTPVVCRSCAKRTSVEDSLESFFKDLLRTVVEEGVVVVVPGVGHFYPRVVPGRAYHTPLMKEAKVVPTKVYLGFKPVGKCRHPKRKLK